MDKNSYKYLNALSPEAFLNPDNFETPYDSLECNQARRIEQYKEGLKIASESISVGISACGTWFACGKDGSMTTSYCGIGYHANTSSLLRGFLDSGCKVIVYRWVGTEIKETVIK